MKTKQDHKENHTQTGRRQFLLGSTSVLLGALALGFAGRAQAQVAPLLLGERCDGKSEPLVEIGANHGHALMLTVEDLESVRPKTFDIKGASGHSHTITLDCATLSLLKSQGSTTLISSNGAGHTHNVKITVVPASIL